MADIEALLREAATASRKRGWYEALEGEPKEYMDGIVDLVKNGQDVNATRVRTILEREWGVAVSASSVRTLLRKAAGRE